jgi:sarcosine oxidase delta subunit
VQREWWFHRSGCRAWFIAERDTTTNEVFFTARPAEVEETQEGSNGPRPAEVEEIQEGSNGPRPAGVEEIQEGTNGP